LNGSKPGSKRAFEKNPVTHPDTVWQASGGHTVIVGIKGEKAAMIDIDHIIEFVFATRKPARGSK
jgi:hypothetical protein